ncbi:MAG: hypothetical protein QM765_15680 [Myxococcales bacterium]
MPSTTNGTVKSAPTQSRRDRSASSGLGASAAAAARGSRAIPQMGQLPGPGRTICGCIGQVYATGAPAPCSSGRRSERCAGGLPGDPACVSLSCVCSIRASGHQGCSAGAGATSFFFRRK